MRKILGSLACIAAMLFFLFPVGNASADFFDLCKIGTPEQVADAIKAGANVNDVEKEQNDYSGCTPLMIAAQYNTNPDVIMELLNAGANVNAVDYFGGSTPLMNATYNSNPAVAEVLITAGANVNARDYFSDTPLMCAAQNKNDRSVVISLIKAGAELNTLNNNDNTALDFAKSYNNSQIETVLLNAGAESGVSISSKNLWNGLFVALLGFFVAILGIVVLIKYLRRSRISST
ncbi:MAG TPA: ankyrin repeat domain-containing protein [Phycisphaerae bacterium]|nr:ankyrin repeat domain-containing protein [Phycisphaerae bacterium]